MSKEYIPLEKLDIYILAMEIGEMVWQLVEKWEYFPKRTVGRQLVEAADSIAANISEGYGRFHYKERLVFCYYSRGSMMETITWLKKSKERKQIEPTEFQNLKAKIEIFHLKLNIYIKKLKQTIKNQK